ncbi:MAG: hypothetical protein ACE5GK_02245 [Nitrospiria bacterium]
MWIFLSIVCQFAANNAAAKTGLLNISNVSGNSTPTIRVPYLMPQTSVDPRAVPIQNAGFQPILLAFDPGAARLFVAAPGRDGTDSHLFFFRSHKQGKANPASVYRFPGVSSGLSYDSEERMLSVANATDHEIILFDRFDSNRRTKPTRRLGRFNFPTGIASDSVSQRLFVADAHPGAVQVFDRLKDVQGSDPPVDTMGGSAGLNGPFALAVDPQGRFLYVSNFDGVLRFSLNDLSAQPMRLPLPKNTLARGLAFDASKERLYIAAPMRRSYFIFDGETMEEIKVEGGKGPFPFSLAIDSKADRLYLAGTDSRIGIVEGAGEKNPPEASPKAPRRRIDFWITWQDAMPQPQPHPTPPPEHPEPLPFEPHTIDFASPISHRPLED